MSLSRLPTQGIKRWFVRDQHFGFYRQLPYFPNRMLCSQTHFSQSSSVLSLCRNEVLEDGPIQPLIPLYLLVGGIVGALKVKYNYPLFVVLVDI